MVIKDWKKQITSIPNLLSLLRLGLIPVYMVIYLGARRAEDYYLAGIILALSCLTDMIDGKIARKFHMITTLGKLLDPFADKATQFTLILCLSIRSPALRPVLILFTIKEGFQLMAVILAYRRGKMLDGALMAGKLCTTVLFVSLILLVFFPDLHPNTVTAIAVTDACFLAFAFTSYVLAYYGRNSKVTDLDPGIE